MNTLPALEPLSGALMMRENGFAVFPLRHNAKIPAVPGWQQWAKKSSLQSIQDYANKWPNANWGVSVGASGHCVIDLDCKEGRVSGYESLQDLEAKYGALPATLTVKTPSGGLHYYFKGVLQNTTGAIGTSIDTRGDGGYVVAPGSQIDGKIYEVTTGLPPAALPAWIEAKLSQRKPKNETNLPSVTSLDSQENVAAVVQYLQLLAEPCIEKGSPSGEHLLQIFYEVRDRGISKELARKLVLEHYNPRCSPPWNLNDAADADHFNAKINNAYRYAQNKGIGYKTPEGQVLQAFQDFGLELPMDTIPSEGVRPLPSVGTPEADNNPRRETSLEELLGEEPGAPVPAPNVLARRENLLSLTSAPIHVAEFKGEPPHRKWLIKDWLPMGEISSMYGKGGSGKSLIAMQLAYSVATGTPFMGLPVETSIPVLGIFCEDSKDELHRRITALKQSPEYEFLGEQKDIPLFFWPRVGESNDLARLNEHKTDVVYGAFRKPLEDALSKMPVGPKLLILDTLSDVYMGDENVRDQVNKFIKTHLGGLAKKHTLSVLLLAHPSRSGQNSGDMLSGSTAWENAVRNRWTFSRWEKSEDIMALKRTKSNYAKAGEEILIIWDEGRMRRADENQIKEQALSTDQKDILGAIVDLMPHNEPHALMAVVDKLATNAPHLVGGKHRTTIARAVEGATCKGAVYGTFELKMIYKNEDKGNYSQKSAASRKFLIITGGVE